MNMNDIITFQTLAKVFGYGVGVGVLITVIGFFLIIKFCTPKESKKDEVQDTKE